MDTTALTPAHILNIFIRHPIYDILFACLSPASLARLNRVNRLTRDAVQDFSSRAFNINKCLSRFFSNPVAFRSVQARTACVISGSLALQFLDRSFYPKSDLDLYVEHATSVRDLGVFLLGDGYVFSPNSQQPEDFQEAWETCWSGMALTANDTGPVDATHRTFYPDLPTFDVFAFIRPENKHQPKEMVQMILTKQNPVASCVMNIITYDSAVSFYPYATFEERIALARTDLTKRHGPALRKYAERGWKVLANPTPLIASSSSDHGHRHFFPNVTRWMDDDKTWFIHLDTTDVERPPMLSPSSAPLRRDPALLCSWYLDREQVGPQETDVCRHIMTYFHARSSILKYTYTVADKTFFSILCDFFRSQGALEHMKMPQEEFTRERQMHGSWTWWDSEIEFLRDRYLDTLRDPDRMQL
ncbi:hypothetical protein CERSUDRAFT_99970 [Gelatoporia subvermispora B]|uniref:Uncharacterized protein n=1 Tax=Ceriporiopsis subvermispora (strain B) TaxID=914234 RepID=M2R183_CERS8|nr:hypothetical protein CERSUDRAFT_99970 [Gelatoporia subvermispora B]